MIHRILTLILVILIYLPVEISARQTENIDRNSDKKNGLSIGLSYDHYDNDSDPWQRLFGEYSRSTRAGALLIRGNVGHRFDNTDYQGEIDFWPQLNENWYGYLNAGISGGDLFPEFRGGGELYRVLPSAMEASLGVRYLRFPNDEVFIITGSLNKYAGNWLLIARPYFTPQDSGLSTSISFMARKYLADERSYFTILGGFGFSPDERRLTEGDAENRLLQSRYIGLMANKRLKNSIEWFGQVKATWQDFPFDTGLTLISTFETGARIRF